MIDSSNDLRVLIIEDNSGDQLLLEQYLKYTELPVKQFLFASRLSDGLAHLANHTVDIIFLDLFLPDSLGLDSFKDIKHASSDTPVIILSGLADSVAALEAISLGAQDYLLKGEFDEKVLKKSIQYSIERKKTELVIRESEQKYRLLFENNPLSLMIWDINTFQILEANETMAQEYGYTKKELLNMTIIDISPEADVDKLKKFAGQFKKKHKPIAAGTWMHKKKSGELMTMEIFSHRIDYRGRQAGLAITKNITEKLELEEKLEVERSKIQKQMTEAIINAQEKERAEIAKELHDNVNQILSISNLYLHCAITGIGAKDNYVADAKQNIVDAMSEIQKLSRSIVPPDISDLGLNYVVKSLIDNLRSTQIFDIDLDIRISNEIEIPNNIKLAIFRIIQEQLNNIIKHAEARNVEISLVTIEQKALVLKILDDGKGFDLTKFTSGIGITNIKNRVEVYNGTMQLRSSPGNGCYLKVVFDAKAYHHK